MKAVWIWFTRWVQLFRAQRKKGSMNESPLRKARGGNEEGSYYRKAGLNQNMWD